MKTDNKKIQKALNLMNDLKALEDFNQTIYDFIWNVNIEDKNLYKDFENKTRELIEIAELAITQQTKLIKDLLN